MNSIHSQIIEELADSDELACTLKLTEDASVVCDDRAASGIQFLEAQKNKSYSETLRCERNVADQEPTFSDDPSRSEQHANRSGRTSEPDANGCEQHPNLISFKQTRR